MYLKWLWFSHLTITREVFSVRETHKFFLKYDHILGFNKSACGLWEKKGRKRASKLTAKLEWTENWFSVPGNVGYIFGIFKVSDTTQMLTEC